MLAKRTYSIDLKIVLNTKEIDSLLKDTGDVEFSRDKTLRKKLIALLKETDRDVKVSNLSFHNQPKETEKVRRAAVNRPSYKKEKTAANRRRIRDIMKKPNYTFNQHRSIKGGLWLNKKDILKSHFKADMWPVDSCTSTLTASYDWRKKNKEQAKIEDFKNSVRGKYPELLSHTTQFFQKSWYCNPVDYSQIFVVSRPYDEDIPYLYEGRRFSDELLADFAKECLKFGLRAIIEDDVYRGKQCRFILIAEANVDLEQAYYFAKKLPKK